MKILLKTSSKEVMNILESLDIKGWDGQISFASIMLTAHKNNQEQEDKLKVKTTSKRKRLTEKVCSCLARLSSSLFLNITTFNLENERKK